MNLMHHPNPFSVDYTLGLFFHDREMYRIKTEFAEFINLNDIARMASNYTLSNVRSGVTHTISDSIVYSFIDAGLTREKQIVDTSEGYDKWSYTFVIKGIEFDFNLRRKHVLLRVNRRIIFFDNHDIICTISNADRRSVDLYKMPSLYMKCLWAAHDLIMDQA